MRLRAFALGLAFITSSAQVPIAAAQELTGTRGWSAVQAVPPGVELVVEMKTGETIKGKLDGVSETTLTLSRKSSITNLNRNNVQGVYRVGGRSRGRGALIGTGVGGGIGTGVGIWLFSLGDFSWGTIPSFGTIGGGIGAAIGTAFGGKRKRVLVYEAP